MMRRFALGSALAALLLTGVAAPASAAPVSEVIEGEHLRIVSTVDPETMQNMVPGDAVVWDVAVSADAPEPGQVDLSLIGDGVLGLIVEVRQCDSEWTMTGCPGGETTLFASAAVPLDGSARPLTDFSADDTAYLRLDVRLPGGTVPDPGDTTRLRVVAEGYGEEVDVGPPGDNGDLPRTGMGIAGALLLAIGAIVVGIAAAKLISRRREEAES